MEYESKLKIKVLAEQGAFNVKRLFPIGNSYAVVIPKFWVKYHCALIDENYYLKLFVDGNSLVLSPITDSDLAGVTIKRKGD